MARTIGSAYDSGRMKQNKLSLLAISVTACSIIACLNIAGVSISLASNAHASPPEIYPLDKVKRGQKGYGLTTFHGVTPRQFTFEVVDIKKNFLPTMDIILVKSEDPQFNVTGFWQGMSGSPLFIDGKLVCAFSYGWAFTKVPLGGCTPIQYMIEQGIEVPRRYANSSSQKAMHTTSHGKFTKLWYRLRSEGKLLSSITGDDPWAKVSLSPRHTPSMARTGTRQQSRIPVAVSGLSPRLTNFAQSSFDALSMTATPAGSGDMSHVPPTPFALGSSIGVALIRGDMTAVATGTVSYIDGPLVLAFGHPLFEVGEFYAPVMSSWVHTIVPSASSPFVVASPIREKGSLIHDRKAAILADTRVTTKMIPLRIRIKKNLGGHTVRHTFNVEVLANRYFSPRFATIAAMNALELYAPDQDVATVMIRSSVDIEKYGKISFTDYFYSEDGAARLIPNARGLRVLAPLLHNPYEPVTLKDIQLDIEVDYAPNYGTIKELRTAHPHLIPGKRNSLEVILSTYGGKEISKQVSIDVPIELEGSIVHVQVISGDRAEINAGVPEDLPSLISGLRKALPGNSLVVNLFSASQGLSTNGQIIYDLPASALDRMQSQSSAPPGYPYRPRMQTVATSDRAILGVKGFLIKVAEKKSL